jgi:hypothetical protein
MTLPIFRRALRPRAPVEGRVGLICKVLNQARIEYLRDAPEMVLNMLPVATAPATRTRGEARAFRFPLAAPLRIALIETGFLIDRNMREFHSPDVRWLREYAPEVLVMPLDLSLSLADQKRRGLFDLPSLQTAIVVLTSLADSPMTDHHRELLWRAFGVPVFEQLRGYDGTVIAAECEVHDGLHINEAEAILQLHLNELLATQLTALEEPVVRARTGLSAEIVTGHCECGAETPRLKNLTPLAMRRSISSFAPDGRTSATPAPVR